MSSQRPVLYVDLMSQPSRAVVIFCRWAIESLRLCLGQPVWLRGPVGVPKLGRKAAEVAFQMRKACISNVKSDLCVCRVCGIDADERPIKIAKKEQQSPQYLAVNPLGKLPCLQVLLE